MKEMKEPKNYIITHSPCESIDKFSDFYSSHYYPVTKSGWKLMCNVILLTAL